MARPQADRKSVLALCSVPVLALLLASCAANPTLIQVAQRRQAHGQRADPYGPYTITDLDVLNYTEQEKKSLAAHFSSAAFVRYGSSSTQVTLATLAGSAKTFGWSAGTASGLALGSAYIFSLGQLIDAKSHAQAYEQAFVAIQASESNFLFHQVGARFTKTAGSDRFTVDSTGAVVGGIAGIPSSTKLTLDGETLYYRVGKTLKVLDDVLASRIPDLQDLKEAKGDSSPEVAGPQKTGTQQGHSITDNRRTSGSHPPKPPPESSSRVPLTPDQIVQLQKDLILSEDDDPPHSIPDDKKIEAAIALGSNASPEIADPRKRLHLIITHTTDQDTLYKIQKALH